MRQQILIKVDYISRVKNIQPLETQTLKRFELKISPTDYKIFESLESKVDRLIHYKSSMLNSY